MTNVYDILFTALIAFPFLGIAAFIEASLTDSGFFTILLGIAFWAIVVCGGILAIQTLGVIWG